MGGDLLTWIPQPLAPALLHIWLSISYIVFKGIFLILIITSPQSFCPEEMLFYVEIWERRNSEPVEISWTECHVTEAIRNTTVLSRK